MSRRLDLSQFRGDDSDDEVPKKQLELTDLKRNVFTVGNTKKSKKDLEKEAEEKKRIEEEKAAALALAEFEDAFEKPGSSFGTSGVRGFIGGVRGGFVRAGGAGNATPYEPPRGPSMAQPPSGPSGPPKGPAAMGYARPTPRAMFKAPSPPPSAGPKPKGKRAMDSFLEEIKSNQAVREQRLGKKAKMEGSSVTALAAWEGTSGGRPIGEAESTNLFVGNLPSNVTEETLGLFFAKIGPVGTVKIMWPRGDIDSSIGGVVTSSRWAKPGLQGFVAYMKRKDAETAVNELDGLDWGGSVIRVGWSKPVPVPTRAIYDLGSSRGRSPEPSSSRHKARSPSYSISPSPPPRSKRRQSPSGPRSPSPRRNESRHNRSESYSSRSRSRSHSRSRSPPPKKLSSREKWLKKVPVETDKFIRAVAAKVRHHGKGFEQVLKTKEKDNEKFNFFFNSDLPDYHLYRSLLSSSYRIPTPPPDDFVDEGYASMYSSDSAEDSERERIGKTKVGKLARKRYEAMLRMMSGKRAEIGRAMEFAVKHAEAADEVADIICQSLRIDDTPVPRKIARLHLVSDILHNSASPLPNVWKYRLAFEQRLPKVFAHLSDVEKSLRAYSGIISADVFKTQVLTVLEIWDRWIVFTGEVSESLRELFLGDRTLNGAGKTDEAEHQEQQEKKAKDDSEGSRGGFKTSGFKSSFKPLSAVAAPAESTLEDGGNATAEQLDGEDMELDGEPMEEEDVDGEAMDEDLDGEAMEDLDGEAMGEDDVDGEPM
ncbi:hypothetical protein BD324DRAFT_618400 [Kockovaella imperatae]|uniref:U2-associated protein SR140 n=1 Tax=Kockovaella imperatae TaxID=4999 RepID=A0A1Y1UM42_9TREE|nr:hypothetical protein BD324DRAFT_618400 [Kockovaella imperatae]ORX39062.1 hypothetical protein BD324DRAFT_618400 [Kockovaella imperatae]